MILVDANIPVYAEDQTSPHNAAARRWWDAALSGDQGSVGLCWPMLLAFIRLTTHSRVFKQPLTMEQAIGRVASWLEQPSTRVIGTTEAHWQILQSLLVKAKALGNLVTDAHLAALAIEHGCELYSTDADFSRFPGLRWRNPLA
jgi:toxin-antitoxin system PIN domain toxin